jgi:hypothetical protein
MPFDTVVFDDTRRWSTTMHRRNRQAPNTRCIDLGLQLLILNVATQRSKCTE